MLLPLPVFVFVYFYLSFGDDAGTANCFVWQKEVKDEQEHEHIYILYVIIVNSKFNDEIGESRQKSNQQSIQRKCESQIMPMKRNSVRRTRNSARKNKVGEKEGSNNRITRKENDND